jgi:hypothetical protein
VYYYEHQVGVRWAEIRPLVAFAFRYTQRLAFHDFGRKFIARCMNFTTTLHILKDHRWHGRNLGWRSDVFVGALHERPIKQKYPRFKDMPEFWEIDWREHLLGIVSHELWHNWHEGHGRKAEFMCETVESDAVNAWRQHCGYSFKAVDVHYEPDQNENCIDCKGFTRFRMDDHDIPLCLPCCEQRNAVIAHTSKNSAQPKQRAYA